MSPAKAVLTVALVLFFIKTLARIYRSADESDPVGISNSTIAIIAVAAIYGALFVALTHA